MPHGYVESDEAARALIREAETLIGEWRARQEDLGRVNGEHRLTSAANSLGRDVRRLTEARDRWTDARPVLVPATSADQVLRVLAEEAGRVADVWAQCAPEIAGPDPDPALTAVALALAGLARAVSELRRQDTRVGLHHYGGDGPVTAVIVPPWRSIGHDGSLTRRPVTEFDRQRG